MPNIPTATTDDVLSWKPCKPYSAAHIREISRRAQEEGMPVHATALDRIEFMRDELPFDALVWLVVRPELVPREVALSFALLHHNSSVSIHEPWTAASKALLRSWKHPAGDAWGALESLRSLLRWYEADTPTQKTPPRMG